MDSRTIRPLDGGAADDWTMNSGTLGQSGSGQQDKEIKRPWDSGQSDWGNKHLDTGSMEMGEQAKGTMHNGFLGNWVWGKGAVGPWNIGQEALWTGEQWTRGQCHIGKWDNGTIGAWDNRQCDNGPMSNETMDIGTVVTEQLADACLSVWQT